MRNTNLSPMGIATLLASTVAAGILIAPTTAQAVDNEPAWIKACSFRIPVDAEATSVAEVQISAQDRKRIKRCAKQQSKHSPGWRSIAVLPDVGRDDAAMNYTTAKIKRLFAAEGCSVWGTRGSNGTCVLDNQTGIDRALVWDAFTPVEPGFDGAPRGFDGHVEIAVIH